MYGCRTSREEHGEETQVGHQFQAPIVKITIILVILLPLVKADVVAQSNSASQSILLEVRPVTKISIMGGIVPLVINDAVAGSGLIAVSDESSKYSLVTNADNMKIVASINEHAPAGTRLLINVSSGNATSAGLVDISNALIPIDEIGRAHV